MKNYAVKVLLVIACLSFTSVHADASSHPKLILTKVGVEKIRANLGKVPLFDASLESIKSEVDSEIEKGIDTPIPKDYSGGYTHERHKLNFQTAQKAGLLFQILQDEKYATYVRDMLFQYEQIYRSLPVHPKPRSYARGKLFWQCLNDSNWLVYMAQAYDAIYEWLSPEERNQLENNLFRPFADFISIENPQFFNRVHNHSAWGTAAVGMIGLVMDDQELVDRALFGIQESSIETGARDNDGGFIREEGQLPGFLSNLEQPFSPDGYFTEGPYYQRYAMYPFMIFALAMHNVQPDRKVFEYKDNVLLKAVDALLNLSDADGEFFPLNDGQKGMSYANAALISAVNFAYYYGDRNPQLLSIAEQQGQVLLDQSGLEVALAIRDQKAKPYAKQSINFLDGPKGKQGGVGILRFGGEDLTLVFKYSAQGLSHGHYDKLSFSLYEKGDEVIQDYGLVRFVNIAQKGGGNYLKENKTWAKQTIAHNTITQNEVSHFEGKYSVGSKHHSQLHFFDASEADVQAVSATESNAYPGTRMHRTMAMIKGKDFDKPFVLDLFKISSHSNNQYDLPFYFMGQMLDTNFAIETPRTLTAMGDSQGYQHLFLEGFGRPSFPNAKFTWLANDKFYTLTSIVSAADELLFTRLGANDPAFNLRRDAGFMLRRKNVKDTTFISVIEPHGSYSPVSELAMNAKSRITELSLIHDDEEYTAVSIKDIKGERLIFVMSNQNSLPQKIHRLQVDKDVFEWQGVFSFFEKE